MQSIDYMLLNYNFLKIKLEIWVKIRYFYYKYQLMK